MMSDPLRERFARADTDGDGSIDEAELRVLLDALGVGYTDSQVHATFVAMDDNADGKIGLEEFRSWWTAR